MCCHGGQWSQTSQITACRYHACLWKKKSHRGISNMASSLLLCLMQPYKEASPYEEHCAVVETMQELPFFHGKSLWNCFVTPSVQPQQQSAPSANLGSLVSISIFYCSAKPSAIVLIWRRYVYLKWPVAFRYSPRTVSRSFTYNCIPA